MTVARSTRKPGIAKRVLREGLTLYRSSIAGACISPEAQQIIHDFKGCSFQENACTSVSLPRTEDKKTQAGSEHNE